MHIFVVESTLFNVLYAVVTMLNRTPLLAATLLLGACASSVDTQVGLIYDSSKHAQDLSYNTVSNPYTDNMPMSANAAAIRWLNDTEMFIDLSGGRELTASLVYFLNKLRDEGARVDTTFPIAGKVYQGQSMPQRISAYDMLKMVSDRMNLGYVAPYDTRGRPVIRIHERQGADALKPSQLRPAGVLESIQVHHEEPLLSITQRLAAEKGYESVMFEFRSGVENPVNVPAHFSGILQGNGLSGLLNQLQEKFARRYPASASSKRAARQATPWLSQTGRSNTGKNCMSSMLSRQRSRTMPASSPLTTAGKPIQKPPGGLIRIFKSLPRFASLSPTFNRPISDCSSPIPLKPTSSVQPSLFTSYHGQCRWHALEAHAK